MATRSMENKLLLQAQSGQQDSREQLIQQYRPFIIRVATQVCKRPIHWSDDEASICLIAFDEAIDRYDAAQGKTFQNFAHMIMRHRLIDEFRRRGSREHQEMLIIDNDDYHEASSIEIASSIEAYTIEQDADALAAELVHYDMTLQQFGIQLEELEESSPTHRDTRKRLIAIAKQFVAERSLVDQLVRTKQLPLKAMMSFAKVSRRTLERNRKYLIALILIYSLDEFSRIRDTISFGQLGEE